MDNRLHSELVVLFGRRRVEQAEALDVADLMLPELEPLDLSDLEAPLIELEPIDVTSLPPIDPLPLPPPCVTAADMEAVEAAADALLKESGNPHRQRELVDALDDTTALLLCMWLLDNGLPSRLTGDAA